MYVYIHVLCVIITHVLFLFHLHCGNHVCYNVNLINDYYYYKILIIIEAERSLHMLIIKAILATN